MTFITLDESKRGAIDKNDGTAVQIEEPRPAPFLWPPSEFARASKVVYDNGSRAVMPREGVRLENRR